MFIITLIALSYSVPIVLKKSLLQCQFVFAVIMGIGLAISPELDGLWGYLKVIFPMWVLGSISAICISKIIND